MRLIQLWIMKFAAKCPPGKRGRPMSKSPEAAEAAGFEVCEKETRDGRTVAYKTGRQLEKEKEAKSEKQTLRKEAGISAKGRISKANLQKLNELKAKLDSLKTVTPKQENKKQDISDMPNTIQEMYKTDDVKGLKKIANVYGVAPKKGMGKDEIINSIRKGMAKREKASGSGKESLSPEQIKQAFDKIVSGKYLAKLTTPNELFKKVQEENPNIDKKDFMKSLQGLDSKGIIEMDTDPQGNTTIEWAKKESTSSKESSQKISDAKDRIQLKSSKGKEAVAKLKESFANHVKGKRLSKIVSFPELYGDLKKKMPDISDKQFKNIINDMVEDDMVELVPVTDKSEVKNPNLAIDTSFGGKAYYISWPEAVPQQED